MKGCINLSNLFTQLFICSFQAGAVKTSTRFCLCPGTTAENPQPHPSMCRCVYTVICQSFCFLSGFPCGFCLLCCSSVFSFFISPLFSRVLFQGTVLVFLHPAIFFPTSQKCQCTDSEPLSNYLVTNLRGTHTTSISGLIHFLRAKAS